MSCLQLSALILLFIIHIYAENVLQVFFAVSHNRIDDCTVHVYGQKWKPKLIIASHATMNAVTKFHCSAWSFNFSLTPNFKPRMCFFSLCDANSYEMVRQCLLIITSCVIRQWKVLFSIRNCTYCKIKLFVGIDKARGKSERLTKNLGFAVSPWVLKNHNCCYLTWDSLC